ncbi:MAG: hypothetical protein WCJ56_07665 [bacterium]
MNHLIFWLLAATVFMSGMLVSAQAAPERRWDLQFEGFFGTGTIPLSVYCRARDGQWISPVGSSVKPGSAPPKYNFTKSYHFVDLSRSPIVAGKITGPVTIYTNCDNWTPPKHKGFTIDIEVDASVVGDTIKGQWKLVRINSDDPWATQIGKGGAISGTAKDYTPVPLPDPITFNLKMGGAQVGGKPEFGERYIVLALGFQGGKLASAIWGPLSQKDVMYNPTNIPLNAVTANYDSDHISGKAVIHTKSLDDLPCTYTIDFIGGPMEIYNIGKYAITAEVEGAAPIQLTGGWDGKWNAGIQSLKNDTRPWWIPVKDFKPVQPGEHPRLLFRKDDVPALRKMAVTPEGQALIKRLKAQLGGGEAMPTSVNKATAAYQGGSKLPLGTYTIGHAAGFGMLYQLTGEQKYADLAKESFEWALKGIRDKDDRYSWVKPGGALRVGPVLGWYALAYDLAYDGWDDVTRLKFAKAIAEYDDGREKGDARANLDVESLVNGTMIPGSNHFGMQVGGTTMALLAVMGDPGVDNTRVERLLKVGEKSMVRNLTQGFGDGGFFSEGDGCGSMSSHIVFLTALNSWKHAKGMDWGNVERPNARMMALKWIYQTITTDGRPDFWPIRGEYGQNVWARAGMSGAGYFAEGFGILPDDQKATMLWYYNHFLADVDAKAGIPFDSASDYPQYTICALANWPFGMQEKAPAEVLPLCYRDTRFDFMLWRNRWQDNNDILITILPRVSTGGNYYSKGEAGLSIQAFGKRFEKWGSDITGNVKSWWSSPRGEASVVTMANGACLAMDFTLASGVEGMLVVTGKADGKEINLAGKKLTVKFLTAGPEPEITIADDKVTVGKQTISLDKDGKIVLGVTTK